MAKRTPAPPAKGALIPNPIHDISPDEAFVTEAGQAVVSFLRGLAGFFTTAQALESEALRKLEAAKDWQAPKTAEEDVFIQEQIVDANTIRKQIVEHWKITSLVSQFHKRLTGRRDKGADAAQEIATIGNRLHNGWSLEQKQKAARLAEQERRQAELDAEAKRERELLEFEQAAVRAEELRTDLSDRELIFVDLVTGSPAWEGNSAARRAGFKNPEQAANRLLNTPKIIAAIEGRRKAAAIRAQKAARAEAPIEIALPAPVKADIQRAAGTSERTTYSLEIVDEAAFIAAAFEPRYGIPRDILTFKQTKANEYARSMRELVNRWPGCRLVTKTGVV